MKIRISKDARSIYLGQSQILTTWEWAKTMEKIAGMTLEVETDHLFKDQYNTTPIPGISETGLRVMQNVVEEVIDDERLGKARCHWCGRTGPAQGVCMTCGKKDYLEVF
jgi:rRNA maturation endonuclease Nob1